MRITKSTADKREARIILRAWREQRLAAGAGEQLMSHWASVLCGCAPIPAALRTVLERTETLGLYWPLQSEPDLRGVTAAWAEREGKQLALPYAAADRTMHYRLWHPSEGTSSDEMRIPSGTGAVLIPDMVLAPMLGVSPCARRLGYGGGYFDRFMMRMRARAAAPFFLGVVFDGAEVPESLFAAHDCSFDAVITETHVWYPSTDT